MIVKRSLLLLLVLAILAAPACAENAISPYWQPDPDHAITCVDDRGGCQVLQMVMTGSFDSYDPADNLSGRILSAALPMLCAVDDADFAHFVRYFDVNEGSLRRNYYIALANCLWADIDLGLDPGGNAAAARRVLKLFLDPDSETDAQAQMDTIREQINDDVIDLMAQSIGTPPDFVRYLIFAENWRDAAAPIPPQ